MLFKLLVLSVPYFILWTNVQRNQDARLFFKTTHAIPIYWLSARAKIHV